MIFPAMTDGLVRCSSAIWAEATPDGRRPSCSDDRGTFPLADLAEQFGARRPGAGRPRCCGGRDRAALWLPNAAASRRSLLRPRAPRRHRRRGEHALIVAVEVADSVGRSGAERAGLRCRAFAAIDFLSILAEIDRACRIGLAASVFVGEAPK